jgi:two-component sensor histidine kinase
MSELGAVTMKRKDIFVSINRQEHTLATPCTDIGTGIPVDFDWYNPTSPGLRNVVSFMEQVQGTIEHDLTTKTTFNSVAKEKESSVSKGASEP